MAPGPQSEVWVGSRELWSIGTSELLPGAVFTTRGSGRVLWKGVSRVIMMVLVVGTKSAFRRNDEA